MQPACVTVAGVAPKTNRPADIYTIRAIGQDEFEDVKVPDTPQQPAKK